MEISILGLGLMGGSLAHALRGFRNCRITGYDKYPDTAKQAHEKGAIDRIAASVEEAALDSDLLILCSNPDSIIENMRRAFPVMKQGAVITEICGVKREILDFVAAELPPHIDYIGLHPMAGKEVGGFQNADPNLFRGAGFILIPFGACEESSLSLIRALSQYVGAGRVIENMGNQHDDIIAYTSDLMHISAAALCVDFPEKMTMAHTAGAFRDCTRIANIDADLWTELLTKNAESILPWLEAYAANLTAFKTALEENDTRFIHAFLQKACENKKKMASL